MMDIDSMLRILDAEFKNSDSTKKNKVLLPSMAAFIGRKIESITDKRDLEIVLEAIHRDRNVLHFKEPERIKARVLEKLKEIEDEEKRKKDDCRYTLPK